MKRKKNPISINIEYFFFLMAMSAARMLPLKFCYKFAELGGRLFFIFDFRHRNRVIQHLLHAGIVKDRKEAILLGRKNFIHFAKLIVDIFVCRQFMKPENISEILKIEGPEISKELFFSGKSKPVIIICAHFGNWEMAGQGYTISSGIPLMSVMRPFDNPKIGEYIVARRTGHTHEVCDKKGAIRPLLVALKKGYSVAILADQHASTLEGVVVNFFGHPARTHSSPALLHLKTGIPVLVLMPRRVNDNFNFEFIISEPITLTPTGNKEEDVKTLVQKYATEAEKIIARYPEQWMWAHRRWLDINRNSE
ncbi:MAG: lysophospholipid acyltransferase family protein [Victivallales bacterium]|jgi:KDO2-lipid IV(A) lauroyltransferase